MATLFHRLEIYCKQKKIQLPEPELRQELGTKLIAAWFDDDNIFCKYIPLHKKVFTDEFGQPTKVLSYPKKFIPVIDKIISENLLTNNLFNKNILDQNNSFKNNHLKESGNFTPKKRSRTKIPVYSYKPKGL